MEYLKSLKELGLKEPTDKYTLFEVNLDVICPICKNRDVYKTWWCCKDCSKLPLEEFNTYLFKYVQ